MQHSQLLTLVGASIGIGIIVLGVVAVSTSTWIVLTAPQTLEATFGLFQRCNRALIDATAPLAGCTTLNDFQTAQGLIIAGVSIVGLGLIASILLRVLCDDKWIKSVPQILLIIGPTLILIGTLFYVKDVLGNFTAGSTKLDLGYGLILIVVSCIIGYISAAYFSFINGFTQGYHRGRILISPGSEL